MHILIDNLKLSKSTTAFVVVAKEKTQGDWGARASHFLKKNKN